MFLTFSVESAEEKDSTENGVNSASLWFPERLFKREAETNTGYQPWLGRKKRYDPAAFSDKNDDDYIFKRNQYQWSRMKKNSQYQWSRMRRSPYLWDRIRWVANRLESIFHIQIFPKIKMKSRN